MPAKTIRENPNARCNGSQNDTRRRASFGVVGVLLAIAFVLSACGQPKSPTPVAALGSESDPAETAMPPAQATASVIPEKADDLFAQGNELSAAGQFAEAEAAYRQAIAIDPSRASYWQNLGVTLYQLQRLGDAEESLKTGLQLTPDDAQLNYLLGIVYLQMARYNDSGVFLVKANQLDPNLPEPYYGLGVLYKQQGKNDEAIRAFEKFLKLGTSQDANAIPNAKAELEALRAGQ